MAFDAEKIREDFPILSRRISGNRLAYLDNAATTQKPMQVIDAVSDYYSNSNANAHRGGHALSDEATGIFESARKKAASFIGAAPSEIVFTRNATESLNIVANLVCGQMMKRKRILLTEMEHHSNLVSWQLAAKASGAEIDYVTIRSHGGICMSDMEKRLGNQPDAVSFTHASNVLGNVNDAKKICRMAREAGALSCVDGAQSVPHMPIDVHDIGCDFFAFSGHKMLAPTGIGVLYMRRELGERLEPVFGGGGTVEQVGRESSTFAQMPHKFEPGTQDVGAAVGLSSAIDYLQEAGMGAIGRHVEALHKACTDGLEKLGGVKIYGNGRKTGIVSFNAGNIHAHDVGQVASDDGVMIRAGHHCAQPLMKALGVAATARASFYIYNTEEEAERLAKSVARAKKMLG